MFNFIYQLETPQHRKRRVRISDTFQLRFRSSLLFGGLESASTKNNRLNLFSISEQLGTRMTNQLLRLQRSSTRDERMGTEIVWKRARQHSPSSSSSWDDFLKKIFKKSFNSKNSKDVCSLNVRCPIRRGRKTVIICQLLNLNLR
jgi:hypothetical protein